MHKESSGVWIMAYTTIDDPSAYFQTALYTGNGTSTNAITNDGNSDLQPDWLWLKARSILADHIVFDSNRGTNKRLSTNTTGAEETQAFYSSFDTNGFTLGDSNANVNQNGTTYVNWQWKANGGTTASNTDGSITSTVQANTTAGFSIVQYVGNGSSGATFGHGLGVAPEVVILKNRDTVRSWFVGHLSLGFNYVTHLNQTTASDADSVYWNNTAPSSTVVTLGNNEGGNENTNNFVAYCFKEIQGYSKFGSYTGNGSTDGTFVYTGFSPAWVMVRRTDSGNNWHIHDNKRVPYNSNNKTLYANTSDAEATEDLDMLSNGFKLRESGGGYNASGGTYIYIAFAENPFVSSEGVPTTAR
jgi:hypothetical protein